MNYQTVLARECESFQTIYRWTVAGSLHRCLWSHQFTCSGNTNHL